MENLFIFTITFIFFLVVFMIDYFIKRKKNKLKKFIGMEFIKAKRSDYNVMGIILAFVNAFIISFTGVICTVADISMVWQMLLGFVLLTALIYAFYGIIGNFLRRKYNKK